MPETDYLVCVCMGVMYSEIRDLLEAAENPSFDLVVEKLLVATGCNSCVEEVKSIVAEVACCRRSGKCGEKKP